MKTVEIRLQLLKDIGAGLSKAETVKHLTEKFSISRSAAYYHFEHKDKWLKDYGCFNDVKELHFRLLTQFDTINREASSQYYQVTDCNAKIGFLRVRMEALTKIAEYGLPEELQPKLVKIENPMKVMHLHMWRPGDPVLEAEAEVQQ